MVVLQILIAHTVINVFLNSLKFVIFNDLNLNCKDLHENIAEVKAPENAKRKSIFNTLIQ